MSAAHSRLSATLRLTALLLWMVALSPLLLAARLTGRPRLVVAVGRLIYRGLLRICGVKLEIIGQPCRDHPVLYVANHLSYFDIVVLGSRLDASFVAKQEVSTWPFLGQMAKIAGTVFVDRRARHSRTQRDQMSARMADRRESLILFPEGTSSDGRSVLPFKSALFSVAEILSRQARSLPVQPISIAYTGLDGLPLGRCWRPYYAWYGDMALATHIWMALGLGRVTATVIFHSPVSLAEWGSRKALAEHCCSVVRRGVTAANSGRIEPYRLAIA